MTSEPGKESPELGAGRDQRPRTTLDLTATEVSSEKITGTEEPAAAAPEPKAALPAGEAAPDNEPEPQGEPAHSSPPPGRTSEEPGVAGFLTHMAAGLSGAALTLLIAFALGAFDQGEEAANAANQELRGQLAAATQRLAALEEAAKAPRPELQNLSGSIEAAKSEADVLRQNLAALGARLERIESRPAASAGPSAEGVEQALQPLNAQIAELGGRLAVLTKSQEELRASASMAAVALALQNLRRAVVEGKPYSRELASLTAAAAGPLDTTTLQTRRERGVASQARLRRDFAGAAKAALEASREPGDGSLAGDLLAKARSLVRIRPTGDVPGATPDAILARAEIRLDAGDIPAAIREVEQLQGPAAEAMKPWLEEARARTAAEEAIAQIEARLLTPAAVDERARRGG